MEEGKREHDAWLVSSTGIGSGVGDRRAVEEGSRNRSSRNDNHSRGRSCSLEVREEAAGHEVLGVVDRELLEEEGRGLEVPWDEDGLEFGVADS